MANIVTRISGWLVRHRQRIGIIMIGHIVNRIDIFLFDHVLYGMVIAFTTTYWGPYWGSIGGLAIMLPLSTLLCYAYIRFYDWAKQDWLGLEALKTLRDDTTSGGPIRRMVTRVARLGDIPAFIVMSIYTDPFVVTMYMRKEAGKYDGLTRRDWRIFWASMLLSNAYWTLRWTVIIEAVRYVWNALA